MVVSKLNRSHAFTHDKNKPTHEHPNEQNGQRRNDRLNAEDVVMVVSKLNKPHALTHDKNKPTNEHPNEQNGQRRNDRLAVEDAVAAPKIGLKVLCTPK